MKYNFIWRSNMHRLKSFTVFLIAVLLSVTVYAADEPADTSKKAMTEYRNQTHCPVMGGPIDSSVYTDIQGQRVYHCCPMCSDNLKANPDKYFSEAAGRGILFENIQTTCPVSGELIDTTVYADYKGRRVYFCCENCMPEFAKKPRFYLDKLTPLEDEGKVRKGQQREDDPHKENMHH